MPIFLYYLNYKQIAMGDQKNQKKNKTFRTTIDGYYLHDARKHAKFAFEEFLLCVKHNEKNHCYDIFVTK